MLEKNGIWSVFCRTVSAMLYCLKNGDKRKRIAFTLTEMLIALVVVAILAVLILPVITTRAQNKSFAMSYESQVRQMLNSLTGLHVMENVPDFKDTMMYVQGNTDDYSGSSGAYIKKYMKVSKYCGDNESNRTSGCFADRYYQYKDNDRELYEIEFDGACALLKNGASICLRPQSGAAAGSHTVEGFIDLNGPKGPNVFGRDLRTFRIDLLEHIAYDESDPMETIITPDPPANDCVGSMRPDGTPCTPPSECLTDPSSEACCKTKAPTGPADPCCLWHGNPAASGYAICHPEEEEIEENCQNHTITSPGDPCCAEINDPKCCNPNDDTAFCCATANSGSKACCLAGIQNGSITLNSEHPCCTNFPDIKEQYPQLCIPPCTLDEQTNRTAINPKTEQPYGEKWREGWSLQKPEGGSSYCCDYFSRRKEILSPPGSGPRDGCCMFEDVYNDEFNPVSASHCCRLQKFPKETPAVNELCCSWRFFETDLNGKSWLKRHDYYTATIPEADNPADDEGKDYDEKKFDTCCPYALSQVIKENPPAPWDTPENQDVVWKNCCTLKHLTPECCHFLVEKAPQYGPQALMDIDPRTGVEGVLRQGCCGYDEFDERTECCSRDIDGIQTFRNNEWREVCCMPNSVYTTELTTLNGPSVDCCINAGEQITNEQHRWWWKREAKFGNPERNNRLDGCCNQGLQTSSEGTALRKYPKWQVNCCYLRWVNSNAYETAEDFVTGCCSSSADNPAGEEAWGDVNRDDDRNEDCCAAYGSPDDPAHNRINDSRWYTRCCSPTKRVNTSLNYNYHYKDAGCCKNVDWRDDDNEDCCTYAVDVKDGQTLKAKNDTQWFANCCNHFEDYRGLNNGQGYKTYVSNCCINDKTTANDGMRKDEFGGTPNTLTRKGEPFLKYCCDTTIAENNGNAPSENCCWSFVEDGSGMQTDYDDKALSEAYRGNCCKAYGPNERNGNTMRDSITNITCPELWICEGNGIDRATQADSLNNPGYGLPSCCIASKQHNDNDYWRGACCEFPTYYSSNADYRSICCSPDPSVDYTRQNVAEFNTSVRGTDDVDQKKYCCKPEIADNGYLPSTDCCSYFKGRSNYGKDNDNQALSERYQIECCELSTGDVNSVEDYCSTCDIRWKTGEEKHPDDLDLADAEWNQWNFSGCCKNMHSSHGETDLWLNNCCSFVGDSVNDINNYYGSHENFREHCCECVGDNCNPINCGTTPTDEKLSAHCCGIWGETAVKKAGFISQCCALTDYAANHSGTGHICYQCPTTPSAGDVSEQCCEQWGETNIKNASLTSQCCATAFGNTRKTKGDFCNPCSNSPTSADAAYSVCCGDWSESAIENAGLKNACCAHSDYKNAHNGAGHICYECPDNPTPGHTSAACCGNWSESAIASAGLTTACCSNPDYAANHSGTGHICYSCPANPASGDVSEECCSQWKTNGKFNNGNYASVLTSCCGSAGGNFGSNNSAKGGLCYTCPATPQSGHESETCCKQWKDNNKFNSSNTSIKNTCCGFDQFNADNSAEGGLCEACPFTEDAVSYTCCKQWGTTKLNTNETIKNKCCENSTFKNDPTYTEYCTPPVSCSSPDISRSDYTCCSEWIGHGWWPSFSDDVKQACCANGSASQFTWKISGSYSGGFGHLNLGYSGNKPAGSSLSANVEVKTLCRPIGQTVSPTEYTIYSGTINEGQTSFNDQSAGLTSQGLGCSGVRIASAEVSLGSTKINTYSNSDVAYYTVIPELSGDYCTASTTGGTPIQTCSANPTSPVSKECCLEWADNNKFANGTFADQRAECCTTDNFADLREELCPCTESDIVISLEFDADASTLLDPNDYEGTSKYCYRLTSSEDVLEDVSVSYQLEIKDGTDTSTQQKILTIPAGSSESSDTVCLSYRLPSPYYSAVLTDQSATIDVQTPSIPKGTCPAYIYNVFTNPEPPRPDVCRDPVEVHDSGVAPLSEDCDCWWENPDYMVDVDQDMLGSCCIDWDVDGDADKKIACCGVPDFHEAHHDMCDCINPITKNWSLYATTDASDCPAGRQDYKIVLDADDPKLSVELEVVSNMRNKTTNAHVGTNTKGSVVLTGSDNILCMPASSSSTNKYIFDKFTKINVKYNNTSFYKLENDSITSASGTYDTCGYGTGEKVAFTCSTYPAPPASIECCKKWEDDGQFDDGKNAAQKKSCCTARFNDTSTWAAMSTEEKDACCNLWTTPTSNQQSACCALEEYSKNHIDSCCTSEDVSISEYKVSSDDTAHRYCFKLKASSAVLHDVSVTYPNAQSGDFIPENAPKTLTITTGNTESSDSICYVPYTGTGSDVVGDSTPEMTAPTEGTCPAYSYSYSIDLSEVSQCSSVPTELDVNEKCCTDWKNAEQFKDNANATVRNKCCDDIPSFYDANEELCPCTEESIVITESISNIQYGADYDGAVTYWVKLTSNKPVTEDVTVAYNIRTTKTNDLDLQTFAPYDEQKTLTIKAGDTESTDHIELYFDNKSAIWIGIAGGINYDTRKFIVGDGVPTLPESDCPSYSYVFDVTPPDAPTICDPDTAEPSAPCCSWWMGGRLDSDGSYDNAGVAQSKADWAKLSNTKKTACCAIANDDYNKENYEFANADQEPWNTECSSTCPYVHISSEHVSHSYNSSTVKGKINFTIGNASALPDDADIYMTNGQAVIYCSGEEYITNLEASRHVNGSPLRTTLNAYSEAGYYVHDLFANSSSRPQYRPDPSTPIAFTADLPYVDTSINKSHRYCKVIGFQNIEIDMVSKGSTTSVFALNYRTNDITSDLAYVDCQPNVPSEDPITCTADPDSNFITEDCCNGWVNKLGQETWETQKNECCGIPNFNSNNSELCSDADCPPITLANATKENCQCWKESLPKNPYVGQYDWDTVVPDDVKAKCCENDPPVQGDSPQYCCNTCPTWAMGAYLTDYSLEKFYGKLYLAGNNLTNDLVLKGTANVTVTCTSAFPGYTNTKWVYSIGNLNAFSNSDPTEFIGNFSSISYPLNTLYSYITHCDVTALTGVQINKKGGIAGEFFNSNDNSPQARYEGKVEPYCKWTKKNKITDSCPALDYPNQDGSPTCEPVTDANAQVAANCACWYNNSATYWSVVTETQKGYCCATGFKDSHPDICPSGSTCSTVNEANATKECCKEWKDEGTLSSAPTAVRDKCCKDNKIGNCALYAPEYKWGVGVYTQNLKHPSSGAYISQGGGTHGPQVVFEVISDNGATLRFDPDHSFTADVQFGLGRYGVTCITGGSYGYGGNAEFHALNYSTDLIVPTDVPYASCNTERSYVWDYNGFSLVQSGTTTNNIYESGSTCVVYENIPERTNTSYCTIGGASTGNSGYYTLEGADPYIYSLSIGGGVYYRKVNSSEYKSSVDYTWCSSSNGGSYAECKGYVLYDDSPDAVWLDIYSTNAPNGFKKVPGMTTSDASDGTTRIASIWNKFIAKLNEIKIAIANAFRNTIAKLFNINISTRTAQTDAQISVPQAVDSPAVAKLTRGKYTQGYKAKNSQTTLGNIAENAAPKAHAATVRTARTVPSAAVAKLTKNKYNQGHVAFAEPLIGSDMVRKESNTSSAYHCCVPEHPEPDIECCKKFKANQWKDFDGNQLSYAYKLTCCNNHNVCPDVDFCTPTDVENKTQLYENCLVLADTGNPDKWAIRQCCACLADYAEEHTTTNGTPLKYHERWRKTCCKEAIGATEEATYNKIGLRTTNDYKEHCCLPTVEGGTTYLSSDGSLWGTSNKDERCCNYEQNQSGNSSDFCCGKRQTAMNWQTVTTPAQEEGTDASYRNQCCLKFNKYCSCKQAYDRYQTGYSDLSNAYNGFGIMTTCCENLNKEFNKAGEQKWQETCCGNMINNAANTSQVLGSDQSFRDYCCTKPGTGSDGTVKNVGGSAHPTKDERCCSYTADYANTFCCDNKSTAKNTNGSAQVVWTDTGDGNESSDFRNACCSSVNDKYCTCTGLYGKYPNASDLFSHWSTRGVTCCNDLYSAKSSESLWKQACCPVAQNNTVEVVGNNNTFRSVCCDSTKYSCIYSYNGSCDSNADNRSDTGKDWRCCTDASGNMPASKDAKLGAGNYFCCSNLGNVSSSGQTHSDATRNAGCCKSEGIRHGGEADPGCCTYNAANEITEQCCTWRKGAVNAPDTWTPWIGLLSNDPFREKCCQAYPDKSKRFCTCQYYYDNNLGQLDTDCCDVLHRGGTDGYTPAHGDEYRWKENCCSLTKPDISRSGAISSESWKNSCCRWSESTKGSFYNNNELGCCEWRANHSVFDSGKNSFEDGKYDECCAYSTWKNMREGSSSDTVYHERCCKAGVSTDYDCCKYMYDKDASNTNIFTPGSGCCNTFNTNGFIVDECLTPCDHYYRGDSYGYTQDDVRTCCTNWFNDRYNPLDTKQKQKCCNIAASDGVNYQITNSDYYGSQCCDYRKDSAGSDFSGRSTVYYYTYAAEERGTCSWNDNDCSAYNIKGDSSYCTSLTCSKSRSADRNKYCCLTAFYDMDLKANNSQNNATKAACCSFSEFASHNSLLCTCKADNGSKILTSEDCCEWWGDTSTKCCNYDSIRSNNMDACCGWSPSSSVAEDWKDCCEYWGINSVKGNSSALTECCKDDDFYDDHEGECLGCPATPSTTDANSTCCSYWDREGKFSGGSYSSVKNYCSCGSSFNSDKVSLQCCNYWSGLTASQKAECCDDDDYYNANKTACDCADNKTGSKVCCDYNWSSLTTSQKQTCCENYHDTNHCKTTDCNCDNKTYSFSCSKSGKDLINCSLTSNFAEEEGYYLQFGVNAQFDQGSFTKQQKFSVALDGGDPECIEVHTSCGSSSDYCLCLSTDTSTPAELQSMSLYDCQASTLRDGGTILSTGCSGSFQICDTCWTPK